MKARLTLVAAVAALGAAQTALAQDLPGPTSQVSMCVTTRAGVCGTLCEPFQCKPNFNQVASFERIDFQIAGAPNTLYALIMGSGLDSCLPFPNIKGELAIWNPVLVHIGYLPDESQQVNLACTPSTDNYQISLPRITPGQDVRFQVVGYDDHRTMPPILAFSRATEIRTNSP